MATVDFTGMPSGQVKFVPKGKKLQIVLVPSALPPVQMKTDQK